MDKKTEAMTALGTAYAVNCQFCMEYHRQKAAETGLTQEEMQSAIRVADAVKTGAGRKAKQFAEGFFGAVQEERCCPPGSACCP